MSSSKRTEIVKKHVLVACVVLLVSFSLAAPGFASDLISEIRDVKGFHSVKISGSGTLYITQGGPVGLRIESTRKILDSLETFVVEGTRVIKRKPVFLPPRGALNVYVQMEQVRKLATSGSCEIKGLNTIKADNLEIETSGSGDVDLSLAVGFLKAKGSGSSDFKLRGIADIHEFEVSGSGDLKAFDLASKNVKIRISGSGQASVSVSDTLYVQLSGSGRVSYKGNPRTMTQQISGSGTIEKIE